MHDLINSCYGKDFNRYKKYLTNPDNSPSGMNMSEYYAKKFLSKMGTIERIKSKQDMRTCDFNLLDHSISVEVKSINTTKCYDCGTFNRKSQDQMIEKINLTINDINKKQPETRYFLGIIWIDVVQHCFCEFRLSKKNIKELKLIKLDALIIMFQNASGNIRNKVPVMIANNKKMTKLFRKHYNTNELELFNLFSLSFSFCFLFWFSVAFSFFSSSFRRILRR